MIYALAGRLAFQAGAATARKVVPLAVAGLSVLLMAPVLLLAVLAAPDQRPGTSPAVGACVTVNGDATGGARDTSDLGVGWQDNTATILTVVAARYTGPDRARASVVALATAMQESRLSNLTYGDRDSLGLFQQRPSMGWGTPAQILDPAYATGRFLDALDRVPGWQAMPVTVAAQRVQRSGFPLAYAQWEQLAVALAGTADTTTCTPTTTGTVGGWAHPMTPGSYIVTSPFGMRGHPIRGGVRLHAGIDLAAPTGTPIYAATAGVATIRHDPGGYGNYIDVTTPDGTVTRYAHLSAATIQTGATVTAGQQIGRCGSTGGSTGPHLHYEVRIGGQPTDPAPFMAGKGLPL